MVTFVVTLRGEGERKTANSLGINGLLWYHQHLRLFVVDVVNNPFADFFGAVGGSAGDLDLGSADVGVE